MKIIETGIKDLVVLEPTVYEDERGYFFESYSDQKFRSERLNYVFVQDNESLSKKFVLRGFHYQVPPYAQTKLVRVIKGSAQDVVIDLRPDSSTHLQSYSVILSEQNKKQMLIPRGFAHAFLVLEDDTIFSYKCDNFYSQKHEGGLQVKDPNIKVDWELPMDKIILSEKDQALPMLENILKF
jgi:dTDP-4-dehydrorhamnose 3,5-epimerase